MLMEMSMVVTYEEILQLLTFLEWVVLSPIFVYANIIIIFNLGEYPGLVLNIHLHDSHVVEYYTTIHIDFTE